MGGGEDDRGDAVEPRLGGAAVALAAPLALLRPDRPPLVNDRDHRHLRRHLSVDPGVAGAVEGGEVVEQDDVGPLLLQQQPREAARPAALGLHEDGKRGADVGDAPADPLRRGDQDPERFDPVPPRPGPELVEERDVEAGDAAAQLAAPLGRDRAHGEEAGAQPRGRLLGDGEAHGAPRLGAGRSTAPRPPLSG